MNKLLGAALCASTLFFAQADADIVRLEMGAGVWKQSPSGTITYDDGTVRGTYTSNEENYNGAYAWMLLKHPLPVVPNIRLEYTKIKDNGIVSGVGFKDFTIPGGSTTARLEMDQYDIIPYYNLIDNTFWLTLDVGVDVKVIDATFEADSVNLNSGVLNTTYTDTSTVAVPMLYLRSRVEIPATNIGLEADGKYVSYDGSTVYDIRAKIDYTFDIAGISPGVELGYRAQKFDIFSDEDDTSMKMDFVGFYAGVMLRF